MTRTVLLRPRKATGRRLRDRETRRTTGVEIRETALLLILGLFDLEHHLTVLEAPVIHGLLHRLSPTPPCMNLLLRDQCMIRNNILIKVQDIIQINPCILSLPVAKDLRPRLLPQCTPFILLTVPTNPIIITSTIYLIPPRHLQNLSLLPTR